MEWEAPTTTSDLTTYSVNKLSGRPTASVAMATRAASQNGPSPHTSGLYADMTLDGPEIGTLVIVFDRAKNLPNRKTMGKQNPYCAARLGKEAKKTDTDRRGGQTPRW